MSSILEALNRLEQEKQRQQAFPVSEEEPVTPEQAVAEMFGKSRRRNKKSATTSHPWALMAGALLLGVLLTSVTAMTTVWLVSGPAPSAAVVSVAEADPNPNPDPVHTYSVPVNVEVEADSSAGEGGVQAQEVAVTEEAVSFLPAEKESADTPVVSKVPAELQPDTAVAKAILPDRPPEPVPVAEVAVSPAPEVVEERTVPPPAVKIAEPVKSPAIPDSKEVESQEPTQVPLPEQAQVLGEKAVPAKTVAESTGEPLVLARTVQTSENKAPSILPPAARSNVGTIDINNLPRLSIQEQEDLNLGNLQLNVLRPADKNQPDALAIINLKKVYVGEMIPGTPARLIAVDASAIGVEIDTGGAQKRFRISR